MRLRDGVDPKILCRQHLLGEHNEYHKIFESSVLKNKPMDGYLDVMAVSIHSYVRHIDIAKEMTNRGYNHNSPMKVKVTQYLDYIKNNNIRYNILSFSRANLKMLLQGYITKNGKYKKACRKCQERYIQYLKV